MKHLILLQKIGLDSKIDDLFDGKLVNFTEDLAAWHPKYRAQYNPKKSDTISNKIQQNELTSFYDLCARAKNIVTIGIEVRMKDQKCFLKLWT